MTKDCYLHTSLVMLPSPDKKELWYLVKEVRKICERLEFEKTYRFILEEDVKNEKRHNGHIAISHNFLFLFFTAEQNLTCVKIG